MEQPHKERSPHRKPRKRPGFWHGFTLVEILIILSIVGVLAALGMNVYMRSRTAAYQVQCDVHLKSIDLALDAFRQEHGYFPEKLADLKTGGYITDDSILSCPADPRPNPSYDDYYLVRNPRALQELPILVCPFHEGTSGHGVQAFVGRYTTQSPTAPATLTAAMSATVEHPGKDPVAAPVGMALHGADRIRTGSGGGATITFADGSTADIGHDADLTVLQSFMQGGGQLYTLLHQTIGNVKYQVHHGSKFDVTTPTTTAGALGTQFELRVTDADGTWLFVSEGKVRFNSLSGGDTRVSSEAGSWYSCPKPPAGPPPPPDHRPHPGPGEGQPPPP